MLQSNLKAEEVEINNFNSSSSAASLPHLQLLVADLMGAQHKAPQTSQSSQTVRADAEWLLKTTALHEFSS